MDWALNGEYLHEAVLEHTVVAGTLTPGKPVDLKMVVSGGTIYCFYRATAIAGAAPNQWRFAFSYKAGRFGAGRFGIVGRGHAGIQWDLLYPGKDKVVQYDNYVDFWNISYSNGVMDWTLEEIFKHYAWGGYTEAQFRTPLVDQPQAFGQQGTYQFNVPATNPVIDFKVSIPTGGEAGVFLRSVQQDASTEHIRIGVVAATELYDGTTKEVKSYLVKRVYDNTGTELPELRDYFPTPFLVNENVALPVRISVRDTTYSMWVAGNYVGHFHDKTELGLYFGMYASGGASIFSDIYLPELYEVPDYALLDVGQSYFDAIKKVIDKRQIKWVWQYDGSLMFSYFETHDVGPTFEDNLTQSSLRKSDRFYSRVKVEGAYISATYASPTMLAKGERFTTVHLPNVFHSEFAYKEAKLFIERAAEELVQATLTGLPDLQVQPEDQITMVVAEQNQNTNFYIDSVEITFKLAKRPTYEMVLGVRQVVEL